MDRKSVNISIRSVLNSSPNPLTINEVWVDYIKLCGSPVPLRELGFRSLHEYFRSIPDVVSLDEPNSPYSLVRAVTDEKSKHIAQFVREQKVSKNTRLPLRRRIRRGPIQNDFVPLSLQRRILQTLTRYKDGLHIEDLREIVADIQRELQLQCPFDSVLRKISSFILQSGDDICLSRQYLNQISAENSQNLPRRPNEIITVSESGTEDDEYDDYLSGTSGSEDYVYNSPSRSTEDVRSKLSTRQRSVEANRDGSSLSTRSLISDTLVKNCFALLDENPQGFWLTDLEVKYENKFGYRLDTLQHGFDCVLDMVIHLKDVFNMIKFEKSGDRYLRDARKVPLDSTSAEQGELPKSIVQEIKRLLMKRSNHQLYTDELASEYKECYKKTLDPADFGFSNMDSLLKSLNDNESSVFSFKQVRQRTVMYLKVSPNEEQNNIEEIDSDGALPCNYDFNFLPREVCNYDFELPTNPILHKLVSGQRMSVKIAEVYGPERFYLHFADDVDNLISMMEDLHIFYENNSNTYELSHDTVRRRMLCACPFHQDSKWHRVQVIMCRSMSEVKVRYFDYGTVREVSVGKLRYLHSDFARLPALSVRTKLSGIKTKKFDESQKEEQKEYSRLLGESFFDLANDAKELQVEIVSVDVMNSSMEVYLFATYEGGKVISIHEKLISDGLVNKEIDDVAEIPLPPMPKQKPATNVASSSLSSTSTLTSTTANGGQSKSEKNRPPPGIPIPPNLNTTTTAASMSTQTSNQTKTTFNGYTQSKMNPLKAPFYPPGYNPPPAPPSVPAAMYGPPTHSIPMGQSMPHPPTYIYPPAVRPPHMYTTAPTYPPVSMYGPPYGTFSVPHPATFYDYYGNPAAMRMPIPTTYANYAASPQEAPKPPPGINYKPVKTAPSIPAAATTTGIPLYKSAASLTSLNQGSCFEHGALNTYCSCGLDCSRNMLPSVQPQTPSAQQNVKPEWISKLEVVRDLVLTKDMSPQSVTGKLKEIIGDINADVTKTELVENPTKVSDKRANSTAIAEDTLSYNLNGLTIKGDRPNTPVTIVENGTVDLSAMSPVTPARSECEFSVKSEGRESTRDEFKMAKIEQLRLFVMLQNKNLKKT